MREPTKGSQPKTRTQETWKRSAYLIADDNSESDKTWRRIRQADRELVENMPAQHEEPLLIASQPQYTGRRGGFTELMLKGPDENFVRKLANLMPVPKKKEHKMVMTDGYEMVKEEI